MSRGGVMMRGRGGVIIVSRGECWYFNLPVGLCVVVVGVGEGGVE